VYAITYEMLVLLKVSLDIGGNLVIWPMVKAITLSSVSVSFVAQVRPNNYDLSKRGGFCKGKRLASYF
jgi:hypothetical protein